MLPRYHALPTSPTSASSSNSDVLSRFTKTSNPLGRSVVRWVLLAVVIFVITVFGFPIVHEVTWEFPWLSEQRAPAHLRGYSRPISPTEEEQALWDLRNKEVREAFLHAWTGYKTIAFPNDELSPVSGLKTNKFNGWGVTLFDSLDTMWIMGLNDEFSAAVESVKDWKFEEIKPDLYVPFFETTIRYLGGLLSAFALSGNDVLLTLADNVGQILVQAFNATPTGLPAYSVNVRTGMADTLHDTILFAEATSCQLEFKYLAKLTGKTEYYDKVQTAMEVFYKANVTNGLFVDNWFAASGLPSGNHITVGGGSDSGYEYFLKQWVLSGDEKARSQYLTSIQGIIENLVYITPNGTRRLMYVTDTDAYMTAHRQEHLSCFLPGVLALGAALLDLPPETREIHQWAASGLTYTCYISYMDQQTELGPEEIRMNGPGLKWIDEVGKWKAGGRVGDPPGLGEPSAERNWEKREYANGWPSIYLLRPETMESIFYMWRTTGDSKWRQRGYEIFKAINYRTRTKYGFSSVVGVDKRLIKLDDMPSYFLAETLKYLYLLFADVDSFSIDKWVFNTEAHPFPTFSWTGDERQKFGITI